MHTVIFTDYGNLSNKMRIFTENIRKSQKIHEFYLLFDVVAFFGQPAESCRLTD